MKEVTFHLEVFDGPLDLLLHLLCHLLLFYHLLSSKGKKISGAILLVFVALCVQVNYRCLHQDKYKHLLVMV